MALRDALGQRMKDFYEEVPKTKLMRRTPVAIRIDGKAFHTFTKGFDKPFDDVLIESMYETMHYLCSNIQGCVLSYCQSDEITLILKDWQTLETQAWFDYEVQKICSISASMATMAFNKAFAENVRLTLARGDCDIEPYMVALQRGAMFDSRCFNIPKEEVTNLIYWRQSDATRNSIQMVAQANYSHKQLQNKSCNEIQDMLHEEKGINWNDFPTHKKRGACCIRDDTFGWIVDREIPIFKGDGREYIEKLMLDKPV